MSEQGSGPETEPALHRPQSPVRFVTAASLFDGHDAADQHHAAHPAVPGRRGDPPGPQPLGRRGGDRRRCRRTSQGIAVSSYQGGHVEYFSYLIDRLRERGRRARPRLRRRRWRHRRRARSRELHELRRHPDLLARGRPAHGPGRDDQRDDRASATVDLASAAGRLDDAARRLRRAALARAITALEAGGSTRSTCDELRRGAAGRPVPVLGITGTGGSGKSSLTDELIRRFRLDQDDKVRDRGARNRPDPPTRRWGAARRPHPDERDRLAAVFFRSLATRSTAARCPSRSPT